MRSTLKLRDMIHTQILVFTFIQIIGNLIQAQDLCSCSPLIFEWKLDFQRGCLPRNITIGPNEGIGEMVCTTETEKYNNTILNMIPLKITSYKIIELNLELTPLKSESASGINLFDGDLITFASIMTIDPSQFSGGFQVSLLGVNSALQNIVQEWLVSYSNICQKIPYSIGDSIGWMVYSGGVAGRPETCLFPSSLPSQKPTYLRSDSPSSDPSYTIPSSIPSLVQSNDPSVSPTVYVTDRPSSNPVIAPSISPTILPSSSFTDFPSHSPTLRKSENPTNSPSAEPSSIKTDIPTRLTTARPSSNPSKTFSSNPSATPTIYPSEFSMSYSSEYQSRSEDLARWFDEYVTEFGQTVHLKQHKNNDKRN